MSPCQNRQTAHGLTFRWGLPAAAAAGWVLLAIWSHHSTSGLLWVFLTIIALEWILLLIGLRSSQAPLRAWLWWGLGFRIIGLFTVPILDDDFHRFLWDGRQFAVSGNPYASAPADHFDDSLVPEAFRSVLDHVNYPDVPTIYGPLCQLGFLVSYLVAPGALWPWKLILLCADVTLIVLLWRGFGVSAGSTKAAYFAAWCPLSVFETAYNGHPDGLGVALLMAAMVASFRRRPILLGLFCGLAIGAKVFALLMAPFLLGRQKGSAWLTATGTILFVYAPFWFQGSLADLEGLRAFGVGWEFNSSGYALMAWLFDSRVARVLSIVVVLIGEWYLFRAWWHTGKCFEPDFRLPPGLMVYLWFFFFAPAFNPWYALWLLPFIAWEHKASGAVMLSAVTLCYLTHQNLGGGGLDGFAHPWWVRPLEFGIIILALARHVQVLDRFRN